MPGGFGRSDYVLKRVRAAFEDYANVEFKGQSLADTGSLEPVARGALMRYKSIETRGFDRNNYFGIAQNERFNKDIHTDSILTWGEKTSKDKTVHREWQKNMDIVQPDPYSTSDRRTWVLKRWVPLTSPNALPGQEVEVSAIQMNYVEPEETGILMQLFWTNRSDLKAHDRMLNGGTEDSGYQRGIEAMGEPLDMPVGNLKEAGYKAYTDPDGAYYYKVFTRVKVICDPPNVKIIWQRAGPDTTERTVRGKGVVWEDVVVDDHFIEETHNPFPRTATA